MATNSEVASHKPQAAPAAQDSQNAAPPGTDGPPISQTNAPVAVPSMPPMPGPMPAMPGSTSEGAFDPAQFSAQLQQLQELQRQVQQHQDDQRREGYSAGSIFIPAKDEGKMFIGGLNWETTDESMKNYFSQFGEVTESTVMRDNVTGRSRGFGFLTFKDPHVVTEVLSREHFLDGKLIDPKRAIPREEQDKTAKIFVGGVGSDVTEEDFTKFFEQYGTVIDAQLMIDKDTGRPRGFGFVTFDGDAAVDKIVGMQFLNLKGKDIEVKRAEPRGREQRQQTLAAHGAFGGAANGMDPTIMQQYYQQWQTYMAQMQEAMRQAGPNNPMMHMYQQAMQQWQQGQPNMPQSPNPAGEDEESASEDSRDPRRDRRRVDERRRSRSPPRRRRGGRWDRERERDRHYNRG